MEERRRPVPAGLGHRVPASQLSVGEQPEPGRPVGPSFAKCQRTLLELRPGAEVCEDFGAGVVEQRSALGLPKISLCEVTITSHTRLMEYSVILTVTCVSYEEG